MGLEGGGEAWSVCRQCFSPTLFTQPAAYNQVGLVSAVEASSATDLARHFIQSQREVNDSVTLSHVQSPFA